MRAAKLKPICTLLETQATLICNTEKHVKNPLVEVLKKRIQGVIVAQQYVIVTYNAPRNKLKQCIKITPGRRAPTVSPLDDEQWVSVSSMVMKKKLAETMDLLTGVGAEDVLVMDIHNCRVNF